MGFFKRISLAGFFVLILANMLIVSASAADNTQQLTSTNTYSEDEKALRTQADDYVKAFAAGDYKAIAGMWTVDGTFTEVDGRVLNGRTAIEAYFKTYFESYERQPLEIAIESIKFPSKDVAIEEGHSRLLQGPYMDVISHYIVVHLKVDNKWQMYDVTETPDPQACIGSLQDWQWLIGNWSANPSPTKSINIRASWATGHKFIRCLFETSNASGTEFAMVVIGQDPSNGRIVSWHFDPSGGFGSGKWTKDGQTWIERATSTEADGARGSAIYVLHKLDDDSFTWRSMQRKLGDFQLPDTEEIKISRQSPVEK